MKKLLALIFAALLTLSLVSCGTGSGNNADDYDDGYDDDVIENIELTYGEDKDTITLYKPENGVFTIEEDGDIITLSAEDYSWDAEIMGYEYFGDHGIFSNQPFVDYYFAGEVSDEYTYYDEVSYYTDLEYDGESVVLVNYEYEEEGYDELVCETFVGFEYKAGDDYGLIGCRFLFDENIDDEVFIATFAQIFGLEYDYEFASSEEGDDWDDWDDEDEGFDTDLIVGEWENVDKAGEIYFFFADDYATYTVDGDETELSYTFDEYGNLTLEFDDFVEEYTVSFDGSDTMYISSESGHSIELERI